MEEPHNICYIKCCENYPAHIIPLSTSPKCNNFLRHKRNFFPSLFFVKCLYFSSHILNQRQWIHLLSFHWLWSWESQDIPAPGTTSFSFLGVNRGKHFRDSQKSACMLRRFSHVRLFSTLWAATRQFPLFLGFSRREYWRRLPCPPGDLPDPGIETTSLMSPALAGCSLPTEPLGKPFSDKIRIQITDLKKQKIQFLEVQGICFPDLGRIAQIL